ncbi:hypothetical protein H0E87_018579 [Populus deltoides]|uniref:Uncharacterized protein n=1 Tax=Populus deltoides TaxID=3696 RepID=A0A8T2XRI6_POPDE|nr:hypothetical protein H0E87_018579 [Populus deltoides]
MPPSYFPLRWESTGDQWWYASPIDLAAANGYYDLVRELIYLDTNLLIKLTSLRRIRRLETVWDDEEQFDGVAKCRSHMTILAVVLIIRNLFKWRTLTCQMGSSLFWETPRIAVSPSMCTLASPSHFRFSDSPPLSARPVLAIRVYSFCFLERNGQQKYRVLSHFCLMDWLSHVVKDLITSFDIIASKDYQGNTALHVAAYRGYLAVAEILILASPSLASFTNNYGDTFLHMAVSGFQTPGFRRVDRQIELFTQLMSGKIVNIKDVTNVKNNDGRTALHTINQLNISDMDAMTPLDLLKQRPRSASSEILIKQLISAGGISYRQDNIARKAIVSHLKGHGIGKSPGTSCRIPDAEVFLYTGIENASDASCDHRSVGDNSCLSGPSDIDTGNSSENKKSGSVNKAARRLRSLLQLPRRKEKKAAVMELEDDDSVNSFNLCQTLEDRPIPLRQRYSKMFSLSTNKRTISGRSGLPSPSTGNKHLAVSDRSPSSSFSGSSLSSPVSLDKEKDIDIAGNSFSNQPSKHKQASFNKKSMNQYFCFIAQGLAVEDSGTNQSYKHATPLVA